MLPHALQYILPLERLVVFRLLEALSQVYQSVRLSHFRSLLKGLSLSASQVEIMVVDAVQQQGLNVRIDHRVRCFPVIAK